MKRLMPLRSGSSHMSSPSHFMVWSYTVIQSNTLAIQPVHTFALFSFVLIVMYNVILGPLHSSDLGVWAPGGESQCEVSTQGKLYTGSSLCWQFPCSHVPGPVWGRCCGQPEAVSGLCESRQPRGVGGDCPQPRSGPHSAQETQEADRASGGGGGGGATGDLQTVIFSDMRQYSDGEQSVPEQTEWHE